MSSRRVLKVAQAIREVVAMAILTDLKDPRVRDVTVTFVEVSGDLRSAKVHVSVMGDETKQNLSLRGLQNSAGYLQQRVSNRVDLRYTPTLQFVIDKGVKNSFEVHRILEQVLPEERAASHDEHAAEINHHSHGPVRSEADSPQETAKSDPVIVKTEDVESSQDTNQT